MALDLETKYPVGTAAASADYPEGSAVNSTAPGSLDGFPFERDWLNDFFGLFQGVLRSSGQTAAGTPDTAQASQYLQGFIQLAQGRATTYDDVGAANAYELNARTNQQAPPSVFDRQLFGFVVSNTNTTASTLNLDTLVPGAGTVDIETEGGHALSGRELKAGSFVEVQYVLASNKVVIRGTDKADPVGMSHLLNGAMEVAQMGTSFVAGANDDGDYTLDQWFILSDGNDTVDVTQETASVPANSTHALTMEVETVNRKFGIAQIIENRDCSGLIGSEAVLSFEAAVNSTANLDNIKAAVISWDGAADAPTHDFISAWGAEGVDPTLAANYAYESTPVNLNVGTAYQRFIVDANIDTPLTKNIAVFIWSDVTTTSLGDILRIGEVKLEEGTAATGFEHKLYETELAGCMRLYEPIDYLRWDWSASATGNIAYMVPFKVEKRALPALTKVGTWTLSGVVAQPTFANPHLYGFNVYTGGVSGNSAIESVGSEAGNADCRL